MIKISGLDKLTKQLDDAQKALAELDGTLGTVSFDPNDPSSIEAAIRNVEVMIDERVGHLSNNPIVGPIAEEMKELYRAQIIERAAAARLENGGGDAD